MKRFIFACSFGALTLSSPAMAEEGFGWTGPYIGIQGSAEALSDTVKGTILGNPSTITANTLSWSGGVDAGYNFQSDKFVYGVEVDANFIGANTMNINSKDTYQAQTDWYGTLRGRAGIANDNAMVYVTGGVALADMKLYDVTQSNFANSGLNPGLVAGAGLELALSDKVTLKSEFLHFEYASQTSKDSFGQAVNAQGQDNVVRVGLNYHF